MMATADRGDLTKGDVTKLLRRIAQGDQAAGSLVYEALYADLRRQARRYMRTQPRNHTLEAEGLLHEAYIKVTEGARSDWESRGHFLAVMSLAMRHILIDHADAKRSKRRGGGRSQERLTGVLVPFEDAVVDLLTIHEVLESLKIEHPDAGRVVELRFFLGLTTAESAAALGVGTRSVERLWDFARTHIRMKFDT